MITFKQYLSEARMAPLYHGTSVEHMKTIYSDGGIKPRTTQNSFSLLKTPYSKGNGWGLAIKGHHTGNRDILGISTTRSKQFAKYWVHKSKDLPLSKVVILQLDQERISQRYEIKPYNFYNNKTRSLSHHGINEYEEYIITNKIIPLKYITKVFVYDADLQNHYLNMFRYKNLDIPVVLEK